MARSLEQERRDYEILVERYITPPVDSDYSFGYAERIVDELRERGYTTLARRLSDSLMPYRRMWMKTEDLDLR